MPFDFRLETLTTNCGDVIPVSGQGLTIFVGANNVGKSRIIWDIPGHLTNGAAGTVIANLGLVTSGTEDELTEWLDANARRRTTTDGQMYFNRLGTDVHEGNAREWWRNGPPYHGLGHFLANLLKTDDRLGLLESVPQYNVISEAPANPLQFLYTDPAIESKLSEMLKSAFGFGATLHRYGGSHLHLIAGEVDPPPTNPPLVDYVTSLNAMPLMRDQGDGVRSFAGLLLGLLATHFPVVLVDEPEAFLHPPQARLLGTLLAKLANDSEGQILVASHSLDLLLGALDAGHCDVTVVRVTRAQDTNPCFTLDPQTLRDTWNDPLLRYSRILDSLFHRGVVICESDSDCRFYQSVLEARREIHQVRVEDFLFTHCGGKQRLSTVVNSLSSLRVPTAVIADLDLINDPAVFQPLVEALGGDWDNFSADVATVNAYAQGAGFSPLLTQTRELISNALDSNTPDRITKETADEIKKSVRLESGWKQLKLGGVHSIPNGAQSDAAGRVLANAALIGLFLVPVGELERWIPTVGGHGPKWTADVLSGGHHADEVADQAAAFALGSLTYLQDQ
jgi:hypothetical protein